MQPQPPPPALQQTQQEMLKERIAKFGNDLYAEWEPRMLEEIAAAANTLPEVTGEDIKRLGPFINQMMARIFGLGVTAAIKALAPSVRQDLKTVAVA